MEDGYSPVSIIVFMIFILVDAVFYGFGSAIQNINTGNLEKEAEQGNSKAVKLLSIINHPTNFVSAIQITTNLVGMVTGAFVLEQLKEQMATLLERIERLSQPLLSIASLVFVSFILIVSLITFGIVIPKRCASHAPEKWAYRVMPVISLITIPLMPLTWLITWISHLILRMMGVDMTWDHDNVTEEDIMSMVNEGHEQGVLEANEAEMITNIFEFNDKEAGDIMTHRKNIDALEASMTLKEAVIFILKEGINSRFPVYEKDIDDIIGILHMKDALIHMQQKQLENQPLKEIKGLLREACFIPETRSINTLFREMQSQKIHMQIVVDEYGQTAGIVTMEDILEEIVGNILDEYDEDEEFIVQADDETYLINGMAPLEDVAKFLGIGFEDEEYENYDTINGFLISRLKRIPKEGEDSQVEYGDYLFKIVKVENKMIHSIKVTPLLADASVEMGMRQIKETDQEENA